MRSNKPRNRRPGRPLKRIPVPTGVISAFSQASVDPIPQDPQILRVLIDALLDRIKRKNPTEAKGLRTWIHYLTAIEDMESGGLNAFARYLRRDACNELRSIVLGEIGGSNAKRRTKDHFDSAVEIQRHLLQTFLQEHPYQGNKVEWEPYWEQYQNDIVSLLTVVPCFCAYETMRPARVWNFSGDRCPSEGEFIDLVLASLHGSSPRTIRAALLAASPNK